MPDFINTIDALGDDAVFDSIINGTITEFKDNQVEHVREYAFYTCSDLETVELPNANDIGRFAFNKCTNLKTVNIPKATTLGDSVFAGCETLESVTAPMLVTIPNSVFNGCKALKNVNFPSLETMGSSSFASCTALEKADFAKIKEIKGGTVFHNCPKLTTVILRNTDTVVLLANVGAFPGENYFYVPSALYDSYKAAANWSSFANQFRKLEEWTVDGTVTGELDIENRHMVRFFDEDGTLLSYVIVPTRSTAVYVGEDPVKEGDYAFTGWNPSPTNVTADMDCYAQFVSTNIYTWDAVSSAIADGTYKNVYAIGDFVPLDLGSEGTVEMEIVTFDTDDRTDGSGKAPITWIAKGGCATKYCYNADSPNGTTDGTGSYGGWLHCDLRVHLNETIMPLIPDNVRGIIVPVNKNQQALGANGKTAKQTTSDYVWVPSFTEVETTYNTKYPDNNSRIKYYAGETTGWWTRDSGYTMYPTSSSACVISHSGAKNSLNATTNAMVVLGFCT